MYYESTMCSNIIYYVFVVHTSTMNGPYYEWSILCHLYASHGRLPSTHASCWQSTNETFSGSQWLATACLGA